MFQHVSHAQLLKSLWPPFLHCIWFQIRVVNAFRQGLDARYGESFAEVLRKQTALNKRLSQTSSIEYADNVNDELMIPEIDVERLSSHSHTETAVQSRIYNITIKKKTLLPKRKNIQVLITRCLLFKGIRFCACNYCTFYSQ